MTATAHFKFRLYVAGDGPHSQQARVNLRTFCDEHLPNRHEIEVVDVLREQQRALAEGVMLTPLLVKLSPGPIRKIIGTLSQRAPLLEALELTDGA